MNQKQKIKLFPIFLTLLALFSACTTNTPPDTIETITPSIIQSPNISQQIPENTQQPQITISATPQLTDETLQVFFFDVGQGDCTLIKTNENAMLIDAGNPGQEDLILNYLAENNITKLDYLAATHPHADHIGSMPEVIRVIDNVETLLMPDAIHTTVSFERLLNAVEEKDISVNITKAGDIFYMGKVKIEVLAPNSDNYTDLNNYSIVLRIDYGEISFLLAGDAEEISENEQLSKGLNISADILKVGHHGSNSSTTQKYLEDVSPEYAVISSGENNSYGHPHSETLSRLKEQNITIYRTDTDGTIIFTTDGNFVTVNTNKKAISQPAETITPDKIPENTHENTAENEILYIGNKNSKIFHLPVCGTLPAEQNRVYFKSIDEAVSEQYQPCKRCLNP